MKETTATTIAKDSKYMLNWTTTQYTGCEVYLDGWKDQPSAVKVTRHEQLVVGAEIFFYGITGDPRKATIVKVEGDEAEAQDGRNMWWLKFGEDERNTWALVRGGNIAALSQLCTEIR